MGRGVETIGDNVLYFDASEQSTGCDWNDVDLLFEDLIEMLQNSLIAAFPSLSIYGEFADYPYQENRGILENNYVKIYISEYCGCGAISVVTADAEYPNRADHWVSQIWNRLTNIIGEHVQLLCKLGTFSNGESVFKKY